MVSWICLVLANVFPVHPVPGLLRSVGLDLGALAAVHVVLPLSLVVPSVCPDDPAVPVELIFFVFTLIDVGAVEFA